MGPSLGTSRSTSVQGDHHLNYNNGVPVSVSQFNTPVHPQNVATVTGFFFQDSWSMNRLTLNLGGRYDKYKGTLPAQEDPAGRFIGAAQQFPRRRSSTRAAACGASARPTT